MNDYVMGLDLGKRVDPTAIAVLERIVPSKQFEWSPHSAPRPVDSEDRYAVRHLERIPLGTSYPDVVERVRDLTRRPEVAGRLTLVVDATGGGQVVMDMLRRADLDCPVVEVVVTDGLKAHLKNGVWYVPKVNLVTALQVMVANGLISFGVDVPETRRLVDELAGLRMTKGGGWKDAGHDDLAVAVCLASWRASRFG